MTEQDVVLTEMDTQKNKYLSFQLGSGEYAIPIQYVVEIIGIQHITEVPDVPQYVKGVINLRGKVIPVVDVRLRFNLKERDYDDRTCIIVVYLDEIQVGLIVDTVKEVLSISENQIEPPPEVKKGQTNKFIQGLAKVDESVKMIINMNTILLDKEMEESLMTREATYS